MTMSPLHPCGKPWSAGTHNETVKNLALFSEIINGIMLESRLRISMPWEWFKFYHIHTVPMVIQESRNLIGTLGIVEFRLRAGYAVWA